MNPMSNIGQNSAMDSHNFYNSSPSNTSLINNSIQVGTTSNMPDGAKVAENIVQNNANLKKDILELQKLSDIVMGHKLQFNVNDELNSVIIKIVDPNTNQVLKEIPSKDIQKLKIRLREAIGLLFDEMI